MNILRNRRNDNSRTLNRRRFLGGAAAALAAGALLTSLVAAGCSSFALPGKKASSAPFRFADGKRYKVSGCDWIMLKRGTLGSVELASQCGLDGVEVDMGVLSKNPTFTGAIMKKETQQQFVETAKKFNIEISSVAMSGFYGQNLATRPTVPQMFHDAIEATKGVGARVIFLPLGGSDLIKTPANRALVIERLKAAGKEAEAAGVVIGIESPFDAAWEAALIDEIGSPSVKSYFNIANPTQAWIESQYAEKDKSKAKSYPSAIENAKKFPTATDFTVSELKTLGADRICQIHFSHGDAHWIEDNPDIDAAKIKAALDEMGWGGWLVIERSRDSKKGSPGNRAGVTINFSGNAKYLKKTFQGDGASK